MEDQSAEVVAFSKFYLENVPRLVTFLVHWGLSLQDAADCVQETMIDALPPMWATLEHPYSWCRVVAYRKACNLVKRRREQPVGNPELVGSPLIRSGADLEHFEGQLELRYWLSRLNGSRQREVLIWTYDGATPTEIAAELNMDASTVRSTLRNARKALCRLRSEGGERFER